MLGMAVDRGATTSEENVDRHNYVFYAHTGRFKQLILIIHTWSFSVGAWSSLVLPKNIRCQHTR